MIVVRRVLRVWGSMTTSTGRGSGASEELVGRLKEARGRAEGLGGDDAGVCGGGVEFMIVVRERTMAMTVDS